MVKFATPTARYLAAGVGLAVATATIWHEESQILVKRRTRDGVSTPITRVEAPGRLTR